MTNVQHANENLTIHHKVLDYTVWRAGYNVHEKSRRSAGVTNGKVFRRAEDPNDIVILQDVQMDHLSAMDCGCPATTNSRPLY